MIPPPFLICKLEKSMCALQLGYLPFFQWTLGDGAGAVGNSYEADPKDNSTQ